MQCICKWRTSVKGEPERWERRQFVRMFERDRDRETYSRRIKRYISVSLRLILASPSRPRPRHDSARHAKWIQHKCLLLFNFYVTSIKYHKTASFRWHGSETEQFIHGFEDEVALAAKTGTHTYTHTCYTDALTHQSVPDINLRILEII